MIDLFAGARLLLQDEYKRQGDEAAILRREIALKEKDSVKRVEDAEKSQENPVPRRWDKR